MHFTPALQLETLFVLNEAGHIVSTREPNPGHGPRFSLVRGLTSCAWAVHAEVPEHLAVALDLLAREEPAIRDFQSDPIHAGQYASLLGGGQVWTGPAFTFPAVVPSAGDTVTIDHVEQLARHFHGWRAEELPGCSPVVAIIEEGDAVSVCFCARRSAHAAEAGLETAEGFRGRGLGPRVTAAWALAVRASGLLPLYSTSWANRSSLAVARKLGLHACANIWNVSH